MVKNISIEINNLKNEHNKNITFIYLQNRLKPNYPLYRFGF